MTTEENQATTRKPSQEDAWFKIGVFNAIHTCKNLLPFTPNEIGYQLHPASCKFPFAFSARTFGFFHAKGAKKRLHQPIIFDLAFLDFKDPAFPGPIS
jgi:hypothetical protein